VEELVISEFPQVVKGDGPGAKVIGPGLEDVSLALSMAATDFQRSLMLAVCIQRCLSTPKMQ